MLSLTRFLRSVQLAHSCSSNLLANVKQGKWLDEDMRATVVGNWLKRYGRNAGVIFRGKICAAADEMARYIVVTLDPGDVRKMYVMLDRAQHLKPGEDPEALR